MFKILSKKILADKVTCFQIEAPDIAKNAKAGQFVILRVVKGGERIPLTIADKDPEAGTISIIMQELGKTTAQLAALKEGGSILDIVGPLGHPSESAKHGSVVAIGGGVGVAEVLPVARMYKECGNKVIGIIGARSKDFVILEEEMKKTCDELVVMTDDGSYSKKGFVTDALLDLIGQSRNIDLVYAIGPVPMMKAVCAVTKPYDIKTIVSLNPIMVDGTGMCGACRVTVGGETKFACVHGPEFEGHDVDWNELITRLSAFKHKEKVSLDNHQRECSCHKK